MTGLEFLDLSENSIGGSLPTEIGQLQLLEQLRVQGNFLEGNIPSEIGNMAELSQFMASQNDFIGLLPPAMFTPLNGSRRLKGRALQQGGTQLRVLELQDNDKLDTPLPTEIAQLAGTLETLNLGDAGLRGTLPTEFARLVNLRTLILRNNDLRGSLPAQWSGMANLRDLQLQSNQLQGAVPSQWRQLFMLRNFQIHRNAIEGDLDDDWCGTDLLSFYADCLGDKAPVECQCCTFCCNEVACEEKITL